MTTTTDIQSQALYDGLSIEPGALRAVEGDAWPILRFTYTSSGGEADDVTVNFIGTPDMLDRMRKLLKDSVRIAISHAREDS